MISTRWYAWRAAACMAAAAFSCTARAAPGDILYSDNFNRTSLAPWSASVASRAGTAAGSQVRNSPPRGAYTRHDAVTVTGPPFSAAVPAATLDIWVRRGSDAFSETPDAGEDFVLEYRRADASWGLLAVYPGTGTPGQVFTDTFYLPPDALHGSLALRVRQTGGSGNDFDYWHFDDIVVTEAAPAPTLAVGACEDFENGLAGNWSIVASGGTAGIGTQTSSSPTSSLFLSAGAVEVRSAIVDTSDPSFSALTMWVRRGADAFSEDPDFFENLVVEYLDAGGGWVPLEMFPGGFSFGEIFLRAWTLPAAGRHPGFRLRFRQTAGSGSGFDFWHVDDVCFEQALLPALSVSKVAQTLTDPVNGPAEPRAIPGAVIAYTFAVSNQGPGAVDAGTLVVTDALPPSAALLVSGGAGDPIAFADGSTPSGLTWDYATDVSFSNRPGGVGPYDYVPAPDADGYDAAVTGLRINPGGGMNGAAAGSVPSFSIVYRARID